MSIRNKRLLKENLDLDLNLDLESDILTLNITQTKLLITIKINNLYPFQYPKMCIENVDYIQWLLNKKSNYNNLINLFNLNIPCICCNTITCMWSPVYGIKNLLKEFNDYYYYFYILEKFKIIYKKLNGFDDLIYTKIIKFLYLDNI